MRATSKSRMPHKLKEQERDAAAAAAMLPPKAFYSGQSENSVAILLSGYSFVSLRHETMASITDSIS